MANRIQIITALRSLSTYYGKEPGLEKAQFYLEYLADLEPDALRYAVRAWINRSPFFPKVNELRQAASEYQARTDFLAEEYQRLYDRFFETHELEPEAWENLAQAFEQANRPCRAEHTRKKLQAIIEIFID